jgi:hypothetical protein
MVPHAGCERSPLYNTLGADCQGHLRGTNYFKFDSYIYVYLLQPCYIVVACEVLDEISPKNPHKEILTIPALGPMSLSSGSKLHFLAVPWYHQR